MDLLVARQVHNNVVVVVLTSDSFTSSELLAFDQFGEPTISFSKTYSSGLYTINIVKRIQSELKDVVVRFDGTANIDVAAAAATLFVTDFETQLSTIMTAIMQKQADLNSHIDIGTTTDDITS